MGVVQRSLRMNIQFCVRLNCTGMFSISNKKLFWSAFLYFSILSILIFLVLGPVFHVSAKMGGIGHDGYLELATNMARGNGFVFEPNGASVIHRPPAYVIALIPGMYLPAPLQRVYVVFLNAALAAGTAVFIRMMGMVVSGNTRVASGAVVLFLGNPWIIWSVKNPMAVILQMFIYLLMVYLAFCFVQKTEFEMRWRGRFFSISFGLVCAVSCLSHGVMLPISIIIIALMAFRIIQLREKGKLPVLLLSLLVLGCSVAPWTLRNYHVTGRVIPVVSNSGVTYFGGNAFWGITDSPVQAKESIFQAILRHAGISHPPESVFHFWGVKSPVIDQQFEDAMAMHIKAHPQAFIKKILLNGIGFYFPVLHHLIIPQRHDGEGADKNKRSILLNRIEVWFISIYYGIIVLSSMLVAFGAKRTSSGVKGSLLLLFLIALYAFLYLPFLTFVGHNVYVFGTLPFLYILSAEIISLPYFKRVVRSND